MTNYLRAAALLATCFFFLAPAQAGGVQTLLLTSIPVARTPIVVNGDLSDWPDARAFPFTPLDPGLTASASPALARLRRAQPSASVQACYDDHALYLGIRWRDVAPGQGASVSVNVQTGRVTPVAVGPLAPGRQSVSLAGGVSATRFGANGTATQEIRLPWARLTAHGAPPMAALSLGLDFHWPLLQSAFLRALPNDVLRRSAYTTLCFLTAPDKLFTQDADLLDPAQWGRLDFVAGPHANEAQVSPAGTAATDTDVPKVNGPLPVDGDLSRWNPAQFQAISDRPGLLGSRFSAQVAASYDDHFLYVAFRSHSPGGPRNLMPQSSQAGYAGGDALQIRLSSGSRTINLCAWYDTNAHAPALTADGNDLPNPFLLRDGAKEAFRANPDGSGYTQEIAVPWSVLNGGQAPQPGDTWRGTFQVWWAGLTPDFSAVASATLAQGGGIPVAYRLPTECNVTVALFDAQGHLVRTLVKDAHRRAGLNTEYWDGKDQWGKPAAPGIYQVRGIRHPPIDTRYVMTLDNPGTPPWPTADSTGDWLSDEASPQGAVTDGTNVYLAAPGSEKGYAIIGVGPDGKRRWGYQESSYPRCVSLALDGQYLYALFSGPELTNSAGRFNGHNAAGRAFLVCLNKDTGAPAQFTLTHSDLRVAEWPYVDHTSGLWDLRAQGTFTPENYEGQTRYFANDVGEATEAVGLAAVGGKLYVAMLNENELLVLDAATGTQTGTIPLPHPVGLRALPDGNLLAVSDGKVVRVNPATGAVTPVITQGLDAPHDVTTDAAGRIYVSDWGHAFQVKVFAPDGQFLRAIGKPGGRPWVGAWDARGMLLPRGIAVTSAGQLWVAEDDPSPNRVSVWNVADGTFVRDYLGPAAYGGGANFWVDPHDPHTILAAGTLWHVDTTKKTQTPVSAPFRRMSLEEPFTPSGMGGQFPSGRTFFYGGREYVGVTTGGYSLLVFRRDGARLIPVAALGCRGRYITSDGTDEAIWDSNLGNHYVAGMFPGFFRGHSGDNYVWTDTNNDGKVQADEMQWLPTLGRGDAYVPGRQPEMTVGWGFGFGPDGTIYYSGFCKDETVVYRLDVGGWTADGVPKYDITQAKPIIVSPAGVQGLYAGNDGKLYVTRPYEYGGGNTNHALDCYDRDGHLLWSIAKPAGPQQDDDVLADAVLGEYQTPGAGPILATWLWHANYKPYLVTSDGLYVTSLLDETRIGPKADWDESYRQAFQTPDGAAYLVNGGNDAFHFLQINGLNDVHRFSGVLRVTSSELAQAASAGPTTAAAAPPAAQPVIRVDYPAAAPVLGQWQPANTVALRGSRGRSAHVALARDAANLYLSYQVQGAKWVNKGGNWQTLFISGDCVDLMLSPANAPAHYAPAEGDERLLLSVYQGQPIAVLYRPVVPGAAAPVKLMGAAIDQITRLPDAKIVVRRDAGGYLLQAAVPLADLGLSPAPTATVRGDVGVIFADETGANRSLRLYYYNHDTAMTADLTTEATLQPGEWGNIEWALGPNLLQNGSFEQPFAAKRTDGWAVGTQRFATATIGTEDAYAGSHVLSLQQTSPTVFSPAEYADPDYGAFVKSANGGQGGAYAQVTQEVSVVAGRSYDLRLHFQAHDMLGGEPKGVGHPRGYDSFMVWLRWNGATDGHGADWIANFQGDQLTWKTLTDSRANYFSIAKPFTAPPGATSAIIDISLNGNAEGKLPQVSVDDVEFTQSGNGP